MASHDLRTPLTVISESQNVLRRYFDRLSPEERHHQLSIIDTQVRHMAELLDDVLALSTAQAVKLDFKPSPLDLEAFCRDLFQQMQFTDTIGHQFIFVAEGDLTHVSMDAKILRHVLINLLSNAIKYSPGGGEVRLALSTHEQEAILRISDQGIGIPAQDQPRIFEAFHRAENARSFAGSGLGLAIVKSSVEAHGGTITFESSQGKGTTFIVRLPLGV
jgi:signal transduction histidine kinase